MSQVALLYKTFIRPVLMYASETLVLRKAAQDLLERTRENVEMMGIKRTERIRTEDIKHKEKMRLARKLEHVLLLLFFQCRAAFSAA